MKKADVAKVAVDLAHVLMAAGDELDTIMASPETEELMKTIEQLIDDLKAAS